MQVTQKQIELLFEALLQQAQACEDTAHAMEFGAMVARMEKPSSKASRISIGAAAGMRSFAESWRENAQKVQSDPVQAATTLRKIRPARMKKNALKDAKKSLNISERIDRRIDSLMSKGVATSYIDLLVQEMNARNHAAETWLLAATKWDDLI